MIAGSDARKMGRRSCSCGEPFAQRATETWGAEGEGRARCRRRDVAGRSHVTQPPWTDGIDLLGVVNGVAEQKTEAERVAVRARSRREKAHWETGEFR